MSGFHKIPRIALVTWNVIPHWLMSNLKLKLLCICGPLCLLPLMPALFGAEGLAVALLLSMYAHRMARRWDLWCRGYELFMPLASSPRDAHCHLRRGFTTTPHCYYSQNSLHVAGLIALIRHFHIPPISPILPEYIILCRKRKCLSGNLKQSNCWKVGYYDSSDSGFQLHTVCF